jgi:DNA-binding MarR family transcriptional regulator
MSSQLLPTQVTALDAWVRLLRSYATATRAMSTQLSDDHGLTINDYEALLHLSRADGQRLRRVDLAGALLLTPSGVTRLLEGLERAGLVDKAVCEADARVTYAALTEAGRAKLDHASASHLEAVRAFFEERYSREELERLAELLERIAAGGGDECRA